MSFTVDSPEPQSSVFEVHDHPVVAELFEAESRFDSLQELLRQDHVLEAIFQPIIDAQNGAILGYEGLIRGPSGSPLHMPEDMFGVARQHHLDVELDLACCRGVIRRFAELGLPGKLFLNLSPDGLVTCTERHDGIISRFLDEFGLRAENTIIELTESGYSGTYGRLGAAVAILRKQGFRIALDDLGEGFSNFRLWSELRPEYVKIDMHFVQGMSTDPLRRQFVHSIQEIAEKSGAIVIAEGIETEAQMLLIQEYGIACGQGYFVGRPSGRPTRVVSPEINRLLGGARSGAKRNVNAPLARRAATAQRLLRPLPSVSSSASNNQVYELFQEHPDLQTIPVVDEGQPLGVITRAELIDRFARPYQRELYGKRACTVFMNDSPLVAEHDTSLQQLSHILVQADGRKLVDEFIITVDGSYAGMGTSLDLLRELNEMQISAARYANPLTQLPGTVPINEHIDYLLGVGADFCACYADLDNFKPYNDAFGYGRGDQVIQLTARALNLQCDRERDVIGHIGGDDFLILFQSEDWLARCQAALDGFPSLMREHCGAEAYDRGGYCAEDRKGEKAFLAFPTLSLGLVKVEAGDYQSHHQVAVAAAEAKHQAKKIAGNSLFVERRKPM